jgi:hypothetical protein
LEEEKVTSLANLFASASLARAYILAGHATVTLVSKSTSTRFTYKISRAKEGALYFVGLLSGPENTTDYRYLGVLTESSPFRLTAKSKIQGDAPSFKALAWAWNNLLLNRLPASLEIWHEGACGKCGRPLTVPASIASGIGPVCSEKGA